MLINTVIVFIRDFLPMCILMCIITVLLHSRTNTRFYLFTIVISIFIGGGLFKFYPIVSEQLSGTGVEVLQTALLVFGYTMLVVGSHLYFWKGRQDKKSVISSELNDEARATNYAQQSKMATLKVMKVSRVSTKSVTLGLGASCLIALNVSMFITFSDGYLQRGVNYQLLTLGLIIGVGICLSFTSLFYFFLEWLRGKNFLKTLLFIWSAFLSAQLSQSVYLLTQIDLVDQSKAIWNTSWAVNDSSEYGHILNTLLGYEATPSTVYLVTYVIGVLIPFISLFITSNVVSRSYKNNSE